MAAQREDWTVVPILLIGVGLLAGVVFGVRVAFQQYLQQVQSAAEQRGAEALRADLQSGQVRLSHATAHVPGHTLARMADALDLHLGQVGDTLHGVGVLSCDEVLAAGAAAEEILQNSTQHSRTLIKARDDMRSHSQDVKTALSLC